MRPKLRITPFFFTLPLFLSAAAIALCWPSAISHLYHVNEALWVVATFFCLHPLKPSRDTGLKPSFWPLLAFPAAALLFYMACEHWLFVTFLHAPLPLSDVRETLLKAQPFIWIFWFTQAMAKASDKHPTPFELARRWLPESPEHPVNLTLFFTLGSVFHFVMTWCLLMCVLVFSTSILNLLHIPLLQGLTPSTFLALTALTFPLNLPACRRFIRRGLQRPLSLFLFALLLVLSTLLILLSLFFAHLAQWFPNAAFFHFKGALELSTLKQSLHLFRWSWWIIVTPALSAYCSRFAKAFSFRQLFFFLAILPNAWVWAFTHPSTAPFTQTLAPFLIALTTFGLIALLHSKKHPVHLHCAFLSPNVCHEHIVPSVALRNMILLLSLLLCVVLLHHFYFLHILFFTLAFPISLLLLFFIAHFVVNFWEQHRHV